MNELVSVIIPSYNRKKSISRAVDSCLDQTYTNLEVVICDDRSTDGTKEYLRDRYGDEPRVKVVETPNEKKGANAARNEAIRNACGKYIVFLDSDDYLTKDSIEVRLPCFKEGVGLVYGDMYEGNPKPRKVVRFDKVKEADQKRYLLHELALCSMITIMTRKDVLDAVGPLDESFPAWQDDELVMKIGMKYRLVHCNHPVSVVVGAKGSIVTNYRNRYRGCKLLVEKYQKQICSELSARRIIIWKIRLFALWCASKGQESKGGLKTILLSIHNVLYHLLSRFFYHLYA